MAVFDTTSPSFAVTVIATKPELRIQGRPDAKLAGKILESMTDITERVEKFVFEDSDTEHDVLRLTVDNSDLSYLDHPAWTKGNLVRFLFGYPGRIFGPRIHVVDNVKGFETLEITAIEEASLLNVQECLVFRNKTKAEVVRQIVVEGNFLEVRNLDIDETGLSKQRKDWTVAGQSRWQFLQRLAEKPGYQVYIEGDTLHFHPRRLNRRPSRTLTYFFGLGDLISFKIKEHRVTNRPAETVMAGRNPIERINLSETGSNTTTDRPTLGNQGVMVIPRNSKTGEVVAGRRILSTPEVTADAVREEADTHFRRAEEIEVKAESVIIGDPLLTAKSVVEISGISRTLSGKYYIEKHVHTMTRSGGYTGKLRLLKNALTTMPISQNPPTLDASKAEENTQEATLDRRKSGVRDPFTGELRFD